MKILVAGSTGVVGRLLLPRLINEGHDVAGMTRVEQRKPLIEATGARALSWTYLIDRHSCRLCVKCVQK